MEGAFDSDEPFIYRLNDNGSGPSLLVKVCSERGWRMYQGCTGGEDRWNLWWRSSAFSAACCKTLGDWQFMNHIPKGGSICRKDNLSRLLRCMRRIYGPIYDFSPPCYHLPLEYAKLVSECSRLRRDESVTGSSVVWIHKPVAQSQGRGIFLFRSVCEMSCGTAAVVQRYIERPLLIAGYKFDLRLYVCVPGYRPLTAYMYAEGLARFGTDKYTLSDIHNPYRHLTNSSLNKTGPRYAECKDRIGSGCKWTLKQVRRALMGRWGAVEWLVWQKIRALVTLTLLAQAAGTPPARNCFEFYGFDVLLDDSLKPWLIEVNLSPALAADCEADVIVKQPMLHELFDLLGLPMKHTGLSLLQGPPNAQVTSCSSEDENGAPSASKARARISATRRVQRTRRRRPMPIHCVNIQPPVQDKYTDSSEKNKDTTRIRSYHHTKTSEEILEEARFRTDNSDVQSTSSVPITSAETDETWRGGYSTAATRKRIMTASSWGNGVRWDKAVGRVGQWVRIYPHFLPDDDQVRMEDVRESVAHVSKFIRAAREVCREGRGSQAAREASRDVIFEAALREKLECGHHFQHRKDMDDLLENIIIEIPQINLFTKLLAFNFQSKRIDKINTLLHDSIFAANCEKDEEYFTKDKIEMHGLSKLLNIGVSITGLICWPISFFVERLKDQSTVIPAYVPFETTSWFGFFWSVVLEVVPVVWVGHGHIALDCVAITYYSQIRVQLKIIKHNLESLFDTQNITENDFHYKDVLDSNLHNRFVDYVKRYERLIWYSKEVNSLFNFSITFQFVTSSTSICAVIYKMSTENVLSTPFMFHLFLLILLLTQVFIYCYYGNLVSLESQLLNRSVVMSDWSAVSPWFRKQLLIAMTRWSIPIVPKVCGVIPISLKTFITIVRSSHTLYTILLTKHK
ncbi:hypothetical protein K1T71_004602 [Dendrolimus kikuchii]|uniref:Uncharacterized protein n=1 Tax=Dendrolimus kikuchii TaxID=765133 RepID=A0ACC1D7Y4_9NEOP|nr:hypothetical protein K1T71_004602 [Dendrolimus kikuchii]